MNKLIASARVAAAKTATSFLSLSLSSALHLFGGFFLFCFPLFFCLGGRKCFPSGMKKERMNEIKGKKRTQYDSGGGRGLSYYITWAAAFQMGAGLFSLSRPLQFFTFSLISFFHFLVFIPLLFCIYTYHSSDSDAPFFIYYFIFLSTLTRSRPPTRHCFPTV